MRWKRGPTPAAPDELQSRAYLTWAEWGPDAQIPRRERLTAVYPDVPAETRERWLREFGRVERAVWSAAEQGAERAFSREQFARHLRASFPFLSDAALDKAWSLANYYAWHDGYL